MEMGCFMEKEEDVVVVYTSSEDTELKDILEKLIKEKSN